MLNRRKQISKINPIKIDNYNKFLLTLDNRIGNKFDFNLNSNTNNIINNNTSNTHDTNANFDKILHNFNTIDHILDNISSDFYNHNMYSANFNGLMADDIYSKYIETKDPNSYEEPDTKSKVIRRIIVNNNNINNNNNFSKNIKLNDLSEKKISILTCEKELINIDEEINSIDDLLNLINKYELKPSVRYNINMSALHNIKSYLIDLNNMIGMKDLKANIVDQILYFLQGLHKNTNLSGDYMHTILYGPPGTGKTEIAKIMGKIYSKIGILDKGTFTKVTRSDLIAGYLGQTALKTKDVIKDALGGVLFIDEAYALGNAENGIVFRKNALILYVRHLVIIRID